MNTFQKIKEAKGTKEKIRIAKECLTSNEHDILEVCFSDKVFGISDAGISKAVGYDKKVHGRFEDIGEFKEVE